MAKAMQKIGLQPSDKHQTGRKQATVEQELLQKKIAELQAQLDRLRR